MARAGWTQAELALQLGVTQPTVSRWLKGSEPSASQQERIKQLLNANGLSESAGGQRSVIRVPIVSWVSAGEMDGTEPITSDQIDEWVSVAGLPDGDWMALRVKGDSMDKIAPPGSILVVNRNDKTLVSKKFYVFSINGDRDATFKRFLANPKRLQPYSTNSDHETMILGNHFSVVGRVWRVITELD